MKTTYNPTVYDDECINEMIKDISTNIKNERLKRDISINTFSEMTNMSAAHIYRLENGITKIGIASILKSIIALEISADVIFPKISASIHKSDEDNIYIKRFKNITKELNSDSLDYLLQLLETFVKR